MKVAVLLGIIELMPPFKIVKGAQKGQKIKELV